MLILRLGNLAGFRSGFALDPNPFVDPNKDQALTTKNARTAAKSAKKTHERLKQKTASNLRLARSDAAR